jgi:hypothetical protein
MKKKERGLIMSHEMNLAYRAGKKHVTRRISGLHGVNEYPDQFEFRGLKDEPNRLEQAVALFRDRFADKIVECPCPYGMIGTPMWIKEAHWFEPAFPNAQPHSPNFGKMRPIYKADKQPHVAKLMKWREPYKMPRRYARSFAELVDLRCERLQAISEVGAIDEGMLTLPYELLYKLFPEWGVAHRDWLELNDNSVPCPVGAKPRERFAALIKSLHDHRVWDQNLWTWVIRFQKLPNYGQG